MLLLGSSAATKFRRVVRLTGDLRVRLIYIYYIKEHFIDNCRGFNTSGKPAMQIVTLRFLLTLNLPANGPVVLKYRTDTGSKTCRGSDGSRDAYFDIFHVRKHCLHVVPLTNQHIFVPRTYTSDYSVSRTVRKFLLHIHLSITVAVILCFIV